MLEILVTRISNYKFFMHKLRDGIPQLVQRVALMSCSKMSKGTRASAVSAPFQFPGPQKAGKKAGEAYPELCGLALIALGYGALGVLRLRSAVAFEFVYFAAVAAVQHQSNISPTPVQHLRNLRHFHCF